MSGKTCQLCGRPLGKIKAGSMGDFCSREHRNQYRLRRSMDCLTEANKVATLARRRENPKPLAGTAAAGSSLEPRAYLNAIGMSGRPADSPQLPSAHPVMQATPPRAGIRFPQSSRSIAPAQSRAFGPMLPQGSFSSRIAITRSAGAGVHARMGGTQNARFRGLYPAPTPGNALRVSASARFKPGSPKAPNYESPGPAMEHSRPPRLIEFTAPAAVCAENGRLAYCELPFSGAPDAPAATGWTSPAAGQQSGLEHRTL